MPQHDAYLLHIYRSRTVSGWQWAARLEQLPGGTSRRFTDPEALLAYLQNVVRGGVHGDAPADTSTRTVDQASGVAEGELQDSG